MGRSCTGLETWLRKQIRALLRGDGNADRLERVEDIAHHDLFRDRRELCGKEPAERLEVFHGPRGWYLGARRAGLPERGETAERTEEHLPQTAQLVFFDARQRPFEVEPAETAVMCLVAQDGLVDSPWKRSAMWRRSSRSPFHR